MSTKYISAALLALVLTATASATQAASPRPHDGAMFGGGGHQGEAPPWSFACIKDSGPTECREPMWIYGN
jgi:hypothetical protein